MRAEPPDPGRPGRRRLGFRRRRPKGPAARRGAKPDRDTIRAVEEFVSSRVGVEAYVEPATPTAPLSVVLVAADGEWIRKPIPDQAWIQKVSKVARIPVYDAALVGYPRRMREYRRPSSGQE